MLETSSHFSGYMYGNTEMKPCYLHIASFITHDQINFSAKQLAGSFGAKNVYARTIFRKVVILIVHGTGSFFQDGNGHYTTRK